MSNAPLNPFQLMESFSTELLQPHIDNFASFFRKLADISRTLFGAEHVIVWDNNKEIDHLIAVSESPQDTHITHEPWLPTNAILSANVLHTAAAEFIDQVAPTTETNPHYDLRGLASRNLCHMVGIPILDSGTASTTVGIIELYFQGPPEHVRSLDPIALRWISRALGRSLDYLSLRVDASIRQHVEACAAESVGLS